MKPSELIRLSLRDLAACEASTKFEIEMGSWHKYDVETDTCEVCLAGSVMAQTLDVKHDKHSTPDSMSEEWCRRLEALEEFRTGDVASGLGKMELEVIPDREVAEYHEDPDAFKADMAKLADDLEKAGL